MKEADKAQACEGYHETYRLFKTIGDRLGGMAQLDYKQEIKKIEIAADRKSAIVEMRYSLDVAGSVMKLRTLSTETLVRRNGKVLLSHSDAFVSM